MSEWNEINFYPPKGILPAFFESSLLYRHDLRTKVSILRREYMTTQILSLKLLLLMPYGNPFLYCSNYLHWQIVKQWFKASFTGAFWSNNHTNVIFFLCSIWYIICFERFEGEYQSLNASCRNNLRSLLSSTDELFWLLNEFHDL